MWGLEKLIMDAEELFLWMKQRDYCESPYDGRNHMECNVIKNSIGVVHDAAKRRRSVVATFEYLEEDDAWCKAEVKRIRKQLDTLKKKVGYSAI